MIRTTALLAAALLAAAATGPAHPQQPAPDLGAGDLADDVVRRGLLDGPKRPADVFAVRARLLKLGGRLHSHLVANGGHEHPARRGVMFMCFETYSGPAPGGRKTEQDELFLGFFLRLDIDTLAVQPDFMELIAWDRTKKVYNFWELIGGKWHYRGDSRDVLDDIAEINVGAAAPRFQGRLRCSGCHTLGGPIMKEMGAPHNDWWTEKHGLTTKPWHLAAGKDAGDVRQLAGLLFRGATDAANLSAQVRNGTRRLVSGGLLTGRSLKEQLRSLFTTMEMNLVSDAAPFKQREAGGDSVALPSDFFVDRRLAGGGPVSVPLKVYRKALADTGSRFPPRTKEESPETRHAFLVPARSLIDNAVLDALIGRGLLDEELVADVLAVDFTTPVFSARRAGLIRYVPDTARDVHELRARLVKALKAAPAKDEGAKELLANLTDPKKTAAAHREAAKAYLETCAGAGGDAKAMFDWLRVASQRRAEVLDQEPARHPQKQNILEGGFRLVFPADELKSRPGALRLDLATGRLPGPNQP